MVGPFPSDERRDCIGDMRDRDILGHVDIVEGLNEHLSIVRDRTHAFGDDGPAQINAIRNRACHIVFTNIAGHFELSRHRENGLRCQQTV